MLLRNDVLEYGVPARAIRILWIDPRQSVAYTIAINTRSALPQMALVAALVDDVLAGRARLLLVDPYAARAPDGPLPAKYLEVRARGWQVVTALASQEPAIYQARQRGKLVQQYSALHGTSHPTIYRYLRRYWERGQTADALLPDYGNSGAKGKTRGASVDIKRGRPRKVDAHAGLNADAQIRQTFRAAVARYAVTHAQFSRRAAYRQMIEDFFSGQDADLLPTFGQFNYWTEKDQAAAPP
jgi:hypothetical protein